MRTPFLRGPGAKRDEIDSIQLDYRCAALPKPASVRRSGIHSRTSDEIPGGRPPFRKGVSVTVRRTAARSPVRGAMCGREAAPGGKIPGPAPSEGPRATVSRSAARPRAGLRGRLFTAKGLDNLIGLDQFYAPSGGHRSRQDTPCSTSPVQHPLPHCRTTPPLHPDAQRFTPMRGASPPTHRASPRLTLIHRDAPSRPPAPPGPPRAAPARRPYGTPARPRQATNSPRRNQWNAPQAAVAEGVAPVPCSAAPWPSSRPRP